MEKLKLLDLFSGIGGFSLGLEKTGGFETVAFCEIDKFCQQVLRKHWPHVPIFEDVRTLNYAGPVDVIAGGFPCQDVSVGHTWTAALGLGGGRSGLWSECVRLVAQIRPGWFIAENVAALRTRGLIQCLQDLWSIGYDAEWHIIPAWALGADHERERIWIIAHPASERIQRLWPEGFEIPRTLDQSLLSVRDSNGQWKDEPDVCRIAHGIPDRAHRLKAVGNSIVPQIPEIIGYAILKQQLKTKAA